jgi:hypothetical protein
MFGKIGTTIPGSVCLMASAVGAAHNPGAIDPCIDYAEM